jgi:hypothetical protein
MKSSLKEKRGEIFVIFLGLFSRVNLLSVKLFDAMITEFKLMTAIFVSLVEINWLEICNENYLIRGLRRGGGGLFRSLLGNFVRF